MSRKKTGRAFVAARHNSIGLSMWLTMLTTILCEATICNGFVPTAFISTFSPISTGPQPLYMAKKKSRNKGGKGFGKVEEAPSTPMQDAAEAIDKGSSRSFDPPAASPMEMGSGDGFLTSVQGGSSATPKIDESMPVEDRTKNILREQYGMRTREEQQEAQRREETIKEQRKKLEEWKKMADDG